MSVQQRTLTGNALAPMAVQGLLSLALAFCVALVDGVEWSLACPGMGMAFDCSVLLMSDGTSDVLAGVPGVGSAGGMRATLGNAT